LPISRLTLAIEAGLAALPDSGDIAVFRASAASDLSQLPKDRVQVITGFYPDHQTFSARGFRTAVKADGQYTERLMGNTLRRLSFCRAPRRWRGD